MHSPVAVSDRSRPRWLPSGRRLGTTDMTARHTLVCLLALAHLPVLLALALLSEHPQAALLSLLAAAGALVAALGPFGTRIRALFATLSLLVSSGVLAGLYPEHPDLFTHVFVIVALVALYQDWAVFGLVVVGAIGEEVAISFLPGSSEGLGWIVLRCAFVVIEAGLLAVFWHADERVRAGESMLQAALWEGQASVRARLEETERIRTDLIGTVSHEFRTPLTGIRGAALTLLKRSERLDPEARRQLLKGVLDQQERLSRLLENMLTASRATAADPSAVAEVAEVAAEVAMIAGAMRPDCPRTSLYVQADTLARMDRHALHQVLANLLDNAQQHGKPGASPVLAGGRDDEGVWISVTNEGDGLDPGVARHLLEPFTQADSGPTRSHEGLGMGLYVVRRLVEVYDGTVTVRAEGGWITVEVRLQPADDRRQVVKLPEPDRAGEQPQAPTALPIPKVTSAAAPPSRS